jgi:hypothetical protein
MAVAPPSLLGVVVKDGSHMAPPRNRLQSALPSPHAALTIADDESRRGVLTGFSRRRTRSDLGMHAHVHAHDGRHGVNRRPGRGGRQP